MLGPERCLLFRSWIALIQGLKPIIPTALESSPLSERTLG